MTEKTPDVRSQLAQSIGELNLAWTSAHDFVYRIFEDVTGLTEAQARGIFFSIRSDALQREITKKVVRATLTDSDDDNPVEKLSHALGRLGGHATARNETIHSMWSLEVLTDSEDNPTFRVAKQPKHETIFESFRERLESGTPNYVGEFDASTKEIYAIGSELVDWWMQYARPLRAKRAKDHQQKPQS